MRDKSLCIESFLSELEQLCKSCSQSNVFRITTVVANPNFPEEYLTDLILPRDLDDLIALAISSWYVDSPIVQSVIQLHLFEKLVDPDYWMLELFLASKVRCELFLVETTMYHTRDFWGNLITQSRLQRVFKNLNFVRRSNLVKETQRKRGYHDKGSMKPLHKWMPTHDWSLTQLHYELEQKRKTLDDTVLLIEGIIT